MREMNRLHLYPNHEIAKREFHNARKVFEEGKYGPVKVIVSDLTISCQGITLRFRGKHDLETFIRGRALDKVVSYTPLDPMEEMLIKQSLLTSKVITPLEYATE